MGRKISADRDHSYYKTLAIVGRLGVFGCGHFAVYSAGRSGMERARGRVLYRRPLPDPGTSPLENAATYRGLRAPKRGPGSLQHELLPEIGSSNAHVAGFPVA